MKQGKKICNSWFHKKWFRVVVALVALDMAILGVAIVSGVDIFSFIKNLHPVLRIIGGGLYIIVAFSIFHSLFSYSKLRKEGYLVCQHCAKELEKQTS